MSKPAAVTPSDPRLRQTKARTTRSSKPSSQSSPFQDDKEWSLFITTQSQVAAWNHERCETVFSSRSHGIVAAKRARDGSTVAIADAQLVMLHNFKESQNKTYRLKGTQSCRKLQYSLDSRNLFYTSPFHNAVQSYNVHSKLVTDASIAHPSAITAFSISCDNKLIVSASSGPPTIHVHNATHASTISLAPVDSAAGVVACAFHPSRKSIFALAFSDGVLAAYDYNTLSKGRAKSSVEVPRCTAKSIHAFKHLHDPSIKGSAGITGVEFLPGSGSRAITVGEDGRCFLVDFEGRSTVASWHVGAPATCLSIRQVAGGVADGGFVLAVGTVHGRCVVFDGNAKKVAEKVVEAEGESVLDVEWVHGRVTIPGNILSPISSASSSPEPSSPRDSRKLPISKLPPPPEEDEEIPPTSPLNESVKRKDMFSYDSNPTNTAEESYMKLFSPIKKKRFTTTTSKPTSLPGTTITRGKTSRLNSASDKTDTRSAISAPQLWDEREKQPPLPSLKPSAWPVRESSPTALPPSERDVFNVFTAGSPLKETAPTSPASRSFASGASSSLGFPAISTASHTAIEIKQPVTTDGGLLTEIRSIRASVENARASRLAGNSGINNNNDLLNNSAGRAVSQKLARVTQKEEDVINRSVSAPTRTTRTTRTTGARGPMIGKLDETTVWSSGEEESTVGAGMGMMSGRSLIKDAAGDTAEGSMVDPTSTSGFQSPVHQSRSPGADDEEEEDIWLMETLPASPPRNSPPRDPRLRQSQSPPRVPERPQRGNVASDTATTTSPRPSNPSTTIAAARERRATGASSPGRFSPRLASRERVVVSPISDVLPPTSTTASSNPRVSEAVKAKAAQFSQPSSSISTTTVRPAPHPETAPSIDPNLLAVALADMQSKILEGIEGVKREMETRFQGLEREVQGLREEVRGVREENRVLRGLVAGRGVSGGTIGGVGTGIGRR